jgi:hypothetical protein
MSFEQSRSFTSEAIRSVEQTSKILVRAKGDIAEISWYIQRTSEIIRRSRATLSRRDVNLFSDRQS